jgi:SpoVK/Ycf46/Vps4 family AAA+-type ATPase
LKSHTTTQSGLKRFARRLDAKADWNQLDLPQDQIALLHKIIDHVKQGNSVYKGLRSPKQMIEGVATSALFTAGSGTGKTMAAEVIANSLHRDLYRIDLSAVMSKYIGETEKNLGKLFDAADGSGAILLFDEADALFGKRGGVKDSHDRYASIDSSYLLQRIESFHGLVILASNKKDSLDNAFMKRLHFIVDFA